MHEHPQYLFVYIDPPFIIDSNMMKKRKGKENTLHVKEGPGKILSKGICQEDALSLYISVLCMEMSSRLINDAINSKRWKPFCLAQIFHLTFANDFVLTAEGSRDRMDTLTECGDDFCNGS